VSEASDLPSSAGRRPRRSGSGAVPRHNRGRPPRIRYQAGPAQWLAPVVDPAINALPA